MIFNDYFDSVFQKKTVIKDKDEKVEFNDDEEKESVIEESMLETVIRLQKTGLNVDEHMNSLHL